MGVNVHRGVCKKVWCGCRWREHMRESMRGGERERDREYEITFAGKKNTFITLVSC